MNAAPSFPRREPRWLEQATRAQRARWAECESARAIRSFLGQTGLERRELARLQRLRQAVLRGAAALCLAGGAP
jgi:hypothetical protein